MRITNWRVPEILQNVVESARIEENFFMADLVELAKSKCPVSDIVREGKFTEPQSVSFTPKKGKNKDHPVSFKARRWLGRNPGDLKRSIRLVQSDGRPLNLRVYAGNFKVYWARYVEFGTRRTRRQSFLRPAFDELKVSALSRIESAVRKELS